MTRNFGENYGEFLEWFVSNPDSFLVNTGKTARSRYAMLHTTNCPHLKPSDESSDLPKGGSYIKVGSGDYMTLFDWCMQYRPLINTGFSALCKDCFPDPDNVWQSILTPVALDVEEYKLPQRVLAQTYRIVRDTQVTRQVKLLHQNRCQLCGESLNLADGRTYVEAHHIHPLGKGGPDVTGNVICVCPNHHALLDYAAIPLDLANLRLHQEHKIELRFISYHNERHETSREQGR